LEQIVVVQAAEAAHKTRATQVVVELLLLLEALTNILVAAVAELVAHPPTLAGDAVALSVVAVLVVVVALAYTPQLMMVRP
jgi:hypothetical protein